MSGIPYSVRGERRSNRGGPVYSAYGFFDIPSSGVLMSDQNAVQYITELKVKDSTTPVGMSIASGVININEPGTYSINGQFRPIGSLPDGTGFGQIGGFSAYLVDAQTPSTSLGVLAEFEIRSAPVFNPSFQPDISFLSGTFSGETILVTTVPNFQFKVGSTCFFKDGTIVRLNQGGTCLNVFKIV